MSDVDGDNSIERANPDFFVIWGDPRSGNPEDHVLAHCEQVRSYFQYDKALRHKTGDPLDVPAGYLQFREAYNCNATTRSCFAYYEPGDNAHIVITGPAPTKKEVLGTDTDLCSKEEREGGQVLNGAETEMLNSMLWDVAEWLKQQREQFQQGYQDRHGCREDDHHARGPLGNHPSSSMFEDRRTEKSNSSKWQETTRASRFRGGHQTRTRSRLPTPIASSSTTTLDAIPPFGKLTDPAGYLAHDPSNVTVDSVGIDIAIDGLEEGYKEGYDGMADAEGEDDTMEQGDDAENAGGAA
ncbi:hypothetical protein M404DRAFT_18294 [Pisolithus tinctorius Marx 270]|uniref:Uncharacterized protein n=1 Tax=Pisolithus tinctorius Marx 270 TaxID=870435 RepID=A0A0C3PX84_PISTI|nr:hypothetical protein M404DRAFT_18294 [Pisolithus tinctorius Marx 270]